MHNTLVLDPGQSPILQDKETATTRRHQMSGAKLGTAIRVLQGKLRATHPQPGFDCRWSLERLVTLLRLLGHVWHWRAASYAYMQQSTVSLNLFFCNKM